MTDLLSTLNDPLILWSLFASSILLVLLDYLLPVDWLAYLGYLCFAIFVGATVAATPIISGIVIVVVSAAMLLAHRLVFSRFLTNAPKYECGKVGDADPDAAAHSS